MFTFVLRCLAGFLLLRRAEATDLRHGERFVTYYTEGPPGFLPGVADLQGFNALFIGFWGRGGVYSGNPLYALASLTPAQREARRSDFSQAGIAQLVTAFGERFTIGDNDPTATATELADFVVANSLDGADIDFEHLTSEITWDQKAQWLITFQRQLLILLPSESYFISHSPLPTFFAGTASGQFYTTINQAVGGSIDFYNMQFYNQGSVYSDCTSLLTLASSDPIYAGTSVFELSGSNPAGPHIPIDKIQITKPAHPEDTNNDGFMSSDVMASCVHQARTLGWNGGVSLYKYPSSSYISAVRAAYSPSPARSVAVLPPSIPSKPGCPRTAALAGGHGTKMARRRKDHRMKGGKDGIEQQQESFEGGGGGRETTKEEGSRVATEEC